VTRQVKGEKEVVVEVAALSGKGYPSPVALDTGGSGSGKSSKGKPAATARGKRKS